MEIAMIGLGRMGANMAERLLRGGHTVIGYDPDRGAVDRLVQKGGRAAATLTDAAARLKAPRTLWMMVPSGPAVDETVQSLLPCLAEGDVLVDGGNSFYKETLRRAETAAARGVRYVDCGTSGGIWGLDEGYSLMVGGDPEAVERLRPLLETLAPAKDRGWGRVGPTGSGHFVKMVHNGIEYGLMQAYAEGFSILEHKRAFGLDLRQVAEIWRSGSVVRSWLLDLISAAFSKNPTLAGVAPYVEDTGEGRWTVSEAVALDVPAPVITLALQARLRSRERDSFADRLLAVTRNEFGGHAVRREE